jgi:hypothetical protein
MEMGARQREHKQGEHTLRVCQTASFERKAWWLRRLSHESKGAESHTAGMYRALPPSHQL